MGEIAEMMLEGTMCQSCGEFLGDGDGFPVFCYSCEPPYPITGMKKPKKDRWLKRASNREWSTNKLAELGVQFESKNDGAHIIVTHNLKTVDFWPGTGKYIFRKSNINGRGIRELLKELGL